MDNTDEMKYIEEREQNNLLEEHIHRYKVYRSISDIQHIKVNKIKYEE